MDPSHFAEELTRRCSLPQRHRLLQGYPMLPLHRPAAPEDRSLARRLDGELRQFESAADGATQTRAVEPAWITLDQTRPLILGVLPHAQCNPRVAGCGFCTFPHDRYDKKNLLDTVATVREEIVALTQRYTELASRRVDALYLGGATANLTPRDPLAELGSTLAEQFDLSHAELTLEGVPSLFRSLRAGAFEAFLAIPGRTRRISMGIQTFDAAWLARMGRTAFGDLRTVEHVVDKAHRYGTTTSGDFLLNLPGQSLTAMLADMQLAAATGLDQICVYNLVLGEGTGAIWSADAELLATLPSNEAARANWLEVRAWLLDHGFVQTTLTNFERAGVHASSRRFVYEEASFTPETYDGLGFGPASISTFIDTGARRAVKLVRGKVLHEGSAGDLFFPYDEEDLRLLFLTRTLARLAIDRVRYRSLFGADLTAHHGAAVDAIVQAGLATLEETSLALTPDGMFYADAVAGLLAWTRVSALRSKGAGVHTSELLERETHGVYMG